LPTPEAHSFAAEIWQHKWLAVSVAVLSAFLPDSAI